MNSSHVKQAVVALALHLGLQVLRRQILWDCWAGGGGETVLAGVGDRARSALLTG